MLELKVDETMAGRRIYSVLRKELLLSASLIKRIKWTGGVFVNGEAVHMRHLLSAGDVISVDVTSGAPESDLIPEEGALDILFENGGLLAVNKPVGVIVHPTRAKNTGTLANFAAGYLGGGCHVVNRLDRDTSGIVLFAKDSRCKTLAISALREGVKEYRAVVFGVPEKSAGVFNMPIKRTSPESLLRTVSEDGKSAVTHYEVVKTAETEFGTLSLLQLRLETGRTHQIRVHCLAAGIPVLGDPQYNTAASAQAAAALGLEKQLLHACHLSFVWPDGNAPVDIAAPVVREDMKTVLEKFFE